MIWYQVDTYERSHGEVRPCDPSFELVAGDRASNGLNNPLSEFGRWHPFVVKGVWQTELRAVDAHVR